MLAWHVHAKISMLARAHCSADPDHPLFGIDQLDDEEGGGDEEAEAGIEQPSPPPQWQPTPPPPPPPPRLPPPPPPTTAGMQGTNSHAHVRDPIGGLHSGSSGPQPIPGAPAGSVTATAARQPAPAGAGLGEQGQASALLAGGAVVGARGGGRDSSPKPGASFLSPPATLAGASGAEAALTTTAADGSPAAQKRPAPAPAPLNVPEDPTLTDVVTRTSAAVAARSHGANAAHANGATLAAAPAAAAPNRTPHRGVGQTQGEGGTLQGLRTGVKVEVPGAAGRGEAAGVGAGPGMVLSPGGRQARVIKDGQQRLPPLRSVYPVLVRLLAAKARPPVAGATLVRVLRRLHAYDLLASSRPQPPPQPDPRPADVVKAVREAAGQLVEIAELLTLPLDWMERVGGPLHSLPVMVAGRAGDGGPHPQSLVTAAAHRGSLRAIASDPSQTLAKARKLAPPRRRRPLPGSSKPNALSQMCRCTNQQVLALRACSQRWAPPGGP
ncbi:hypothetical protein V8C86DRAFT_3147063 [Haematococcus lacustris]